MSGMLFMMETEIANWMPSQKRQICCCFVISDHHGGRQCHGFFEHPTRDKGSLRLALASSNDAAAIVSRERDGRDAEVVLRQVAVVFPQEADQPFVI